MSALVVRCLPYIMLRVLLVVNAILIFGQILVTVMLRWTLKHTVMTRRSTVVRMPMLIGRVLLQIRKRAAHLQESFATAFVSSLKMQKTIASWCKYTKVIFCLCLPFLFSCFFSFKLCWIPWFSAKDASELRWEPNLFFFFFFNIWPCAFFFLCFSSLFFHQTYVGVRKKNKMSKEKKTHWLSVPDHLTDKWHSLAHCVEHSHSFFLFFLIFFLFPNDDFKWMNAGNGAQYLPGGKVERVTT